MGQSPKSQFYNDEGNGIPFFQGKGDYAERHPVIRIFTTQVTKRARPNDILFTVRAPVGELNLCNVDCCIGRGLAAIRPAEANNYLFYLLKHSRQIFFGRSSGAIFESISKDVLSDTELLFHPKEGHRARIGSILFAYDTLLENNGTRMALLEKSARHLYREWFVQLRFPGYEHAKIVKGVPEGWIKSQLAHYTEAITRGITPQYEEGTGFTVINQKCIRDGQLSLEFAREHKNEVPTRKLVRLGDVLVNSTGEGTLGRVAQVRRELQRHTFDSHVTIVRPKQEIPKWYFGFSIMKLEPLLSVLGRGATNQTELSNATISEMDFVLPNKKVTNEFEKIIEPIINQLENISSQNKLLGEARDLLLPKLMSGEIEV